jgi:hypothetical protein
MMQHKGMMKEMMNVAGKDSAMCHNMMNMTMENKDASDDDERDDEE